jgi:hypothetical protein
VLRTGRRGDTSPRMGAAEKLRLTRVNVHGISELRGRSAKTEQFPRQRARTCRKQAAEEKSSTPGGCTATARRACVNVLKTKKRGAISNFFAEECSERGRRVKTLRYAAMNRCPERARHDAYFEDGKLIQATARSVTAARRGLRSGRDVYKKRTYLRILRITTEYIQIWMERCVR